MNILDIKNKDSLSQSIKVLKNGGILIFPTDTVYGIGCILNKSAIRKLYKIKNRPSTQPTAVLMTKKLMSPLARYKRACKASLQMARQGRELYSALMGLVPKEFWDGKMTVIIDAGKFKIDFPKMILSADNKIGVRLPKYKWLEKLIDKVGPIVASSANKKGDRPPQNFAEINPQLIKESDLTIQTSKILSSKPSKIFDIEGKIVIRN